MAQHPPMNVPLWKRGLFQVVAGGSAGFVEVSLMQPLDVIKTRIQLQPKSAKFGDHYDGMADCILKMYRKEGVLSFWKGILPPLLVETPKRAIKFTCFEQFKPLFLFGSPTPTPVTYFMSGLCAGLIESFVVNPFEVVKIAQQADRQKLEKASSSIATAKRIFKESGLGSRGLYRGLIATMAGASIFNSIYFGFYHSVLDYFPPNNDPKMEFLRKFTVGFVSGELSCLANTPVDVAKSRIQGPQPEKFVVKYRTLTQTLSTIYREEGFLALYKGFLPKFVRLGPGGAVLMLVFEDVYDKLQEDFAQPLLY